MKPLLIHRSVPLALFAGLGLFLTLASVHRSVLAHGAHGGGPVISPVSGVTTTVTVVSNLELFVDPLPIPAVAVPARLTNGYCVPELPGRCYPEALEVYDMAMTVVTNRFHRDLPPIEVWGYGGSSPGPTVEARVGQPLLIHWINNLTNNAGMYPFWLEPDTNLVHTGHDIGVSPWDIRTVVHLHGAAVLPRYDGYPTNWFRPAESDLYFYGNADFNGDGQTLWYHDHALGVTGNNVYAGLAGFYLTRNPAFEASMGMNWPAGPYEIPLVFQDKDFAVRTWVTGSTTNTVTNLDPGVLPWHRHPVVNGRVAPVLEVEPRRYRFRMLNGAGFRTFALSPAMTDAGGNALTNAGVPAPPALIVIGNEDGYLERPASNTRVTMMPGERVDVIVDFTAFTNQYRTVTIKNAFGTNNHNGDVPGAPYITNLMQFRVSLPLRGSDDSRIPSLLVSNWVTTNQMVSQAVHTRRVTLDLSFESPFPGPPFNTNGAYPFALINMKPFHMDVDDLPHAGDTEIWEIVNLSPEAHPLHIHLLDFRVLNRQRLASDETTRTTKWNANLGAPPVMVTNYIMDRIANQLKPLAEYLSLAPDDLQSAQSFETGPKDVVRAAPFAVTRLVMRWPSDPEFYSTPSASSGDPSTDGRYIFHCHILDHEDNDMMRPLQVRPPYHPPVAVLSAPEINVGAFNQFRLRFPFRANEAYLVETATTLTPAGWSAIAGKLEIRVGEGFLHWTPPPASDGNRFYRVRPLRVE